MSQQFDDDTTTLILLGVFFGPALIAAGVGVAAAQLPQLANWLVEHHILAAPSAEPALVIPNTGGAGLDWIRLVPIVSLLAIAVTWTAWWARTRSSTITTQRGTK